MHGERTGHMHRGYMHGEMKEGRMKEMFMKKMMMKEIMEHLSEEDKKKASCHEIRYEYIQSRAKT
ncbi:MAG: hypothetical protein ACXVHP_08320 [Methanobacterium sp.]